MLDSTNSMNRVQTYHTRQTIPKLLEEGFEIDPDSPMSMTTSPGAEDKLMDTHVNATYHNPKHHLPPYNLNQSSDPLKNRIVSSAAAINISRPNVFGTDAISATIWLQDIESWIAQNFQEEDQH